MTQYGVKTPKGEKPFLLMEAVTADSRPTDITGNQEFAVTYAKELVAKGATCRMIASRMGSYNEFVECGEDGHKAAPDAPRTEAEKSSRVVKALLAEIEKQEQEEDPDEGATTLEASGQIAKVDKSQQNVFGWAYVTHDQDGRVNVDKSGDFVDRVEEIEKSAYKFVLHSRKGDADHTNVQGATMIESMVFTPEKIAKMGLPEGSVPYGWWLGFHVEDPKVWERVEKGELAAFSVHGKGLRKAVN